MKTESHDTRMNGTRRAAMALAILVAATSMSSLRADPCGMVPPIDIAGVTPIERIGLQKTYVFHKNGMETFVIRPGYRGRVDNFGMLIPFPSPPAIRKVPDDIFSHVAAAVDPPEVLVNLWPRIETLSARFAAPSARAEKELAFYSVNVLSREAIGMYEVAVLEAGSAEALRRWMDANGYRYPTGMDAVCDEYIESSWCFVAVKTRVGNKGAIDPRPGQREADATLPAGAAFDGNVQAMGFRFRSDELVIPMRLSAFNEGELRNIIYVLSDGPYRVEQLPESFVVRQIPGEKLHDNLTAPLPLRVLGGSYSDIPAARRASLVAERDPSSKNGLARDLFASDLLAARKGVLAHEFEEYEKELLRIGERLDLRGEHMDRLRADALADVRRATIASALEDIKSMTLTVIDGDFPRDVIARENLSFTRFDMNAESNTPEKYDATRFGPAPERQGKLYRAGLFPFGLLWGVLAASIALSIVGWRLAGRRAPVKARAARSLMLLLLAGAFVTLGVARPAGELSARSRAAPRDDGVVAGLIERLGEPGTADAAVRALVALGDEVRETLVDEALEGSKLSRRGWAIVCLAEMGGDSIDRRLIAIHADARQSALVRTWAGAARVRIASSVKELTELAKLVPALPALGRPIGKKLVSLLERDREFGAVDLIVLGSAVPELQPTIARVLLTLGAESLVDAMLTAEHADVRRQAAAYLATLAAQGGPVAAAVIEAYRFDVEATAVPWKGGALFVPALRWGADDAHELSRNLVKWLVFCERKELTAEKTQIHNNLRSVALVRAAGYRSPGWREVGVEEWLRVWKEAFGTSELSEILQEQRVATEERYLKILEGS